jgi:hypothetical protein
MPVFCHSDVEYLQRCDSHPTGCAVNTERGVNRNHLVLHVAGCPHTRNYGGTARPGGFTERQYIKICSTDLDELREWAQGRSGRASGFTGQCGCVNRQNRRD